MKGLYEIHEYGEPGYSTLMRYDKWRVAVLNYIDELEPENIEHFEKHNETDEVFVLLDGDCTLLFGLTDSNGKLIGIDAVKMLPHKAYNVKKGIYHSHVLSKKGKVLIVENENTSDDNSTKIQLSSVLKAKLIELTQATAIG